MTLVTLAEIIASRVAPMRPAHSVSDDPQANLPPGGKFVRRRTLKGLNATPTQDAVL